MLEAAKHFNRPVATVTSMVVQINAENDQNLGVNS